MVSVEQQRELKPTPEAEALYRRWVAHLNEEFGRHQSPDRRAEIVRDELYEMYLGRPRGSKTSSALLSETAIFVLDDSFDVRNVTLDADYATDVDQEQYGPRRALIWFWQMFDRSPLGLNLWLGLRFRCMLGQHIFRKVGKGVKIHRNVEFTYGYNLTIEDNCTILRGAYLDDHNEILVRAGTTIGEGERVEPTVPV